MARRKRTPCTVCDKLSDWYCCNECRSSFESLLQRIPSLMVELDDVLTRQTVYFDRVGGKSAETALPFNESASVAAQSLASVLRVAVSRVCRGWGYKVPVTSGESPWLLAEWLQGHALALSMLPEVGEIIAQVEGAARRVARMVDRPVSRQFLGVCECGAELSAARKSQVEVRCKCDLVYQVSELKAYTLDSVRHILGSAAELSGLLAGLMDDSPSVRRIHYLAESSLIPKRPTVNGVVFQVGEVVDAHRATKARTK